MLVLAQPDDSKITGKISFLSFLEGIPDLNLPNALLTGPTEQSKLVVKFAQQTTSLRRVVGSEYSKLLGYTD